MGFDSPPALKFLFPVRCLPGGDSSRSPPALLVAVPPRPRRQPRRERREAGPAMTAEEKRSLQCYRRYIERSLNPVYILGNMADWLPDGEGPAAACCPRRCLAAFPPPARAGSARLPAAGPAARPHSLPSSGFC